MAFGNMNDSDSDEQDSAPEPQTPKRPGPILHTPKGSNPFAKMILPLGILIIIGVAGYFYYKYKIAKPATPATSVNMSQVDTSQALPPDSAAAQQQSPAPAQQQGEQAKQTANPPSTQPTQKTEPAPAKFKPIPEKKTSEPKQAAKKQSSPMTSTPHKQAAAKQQQPKSSAPKSHAKSGGTIPPKGPDFESSSGNFVIYVGSFKNQAGAKDTERRWKEAGYPTHFTTKGAWYRVSIGNYPSKDEGKRVAQKMSEAFEDGYWVDVLE